MGSTRLPGKILRPLHHTTVLGSILSRLSHLKQPATTVVATTDTLKDDVVEAFCRKNGVICFRGCEANVLERFYRCAEHYKFDHIVRLTGDNPFPDIEELDNLIELHCTLGNAFSHSFPSLPVGMGAEIFTFSALEQSFLEGKAPHHLEHVDEYMLENPGKFKTTVLEVTSGKRRPDIRLTVDTEEDLRRARFVAENASCEHFSTEEAIRLCTEFA